MNVVVILDINVAHMSGDCNKNKGYCDHICLQEKNEITCTCYKGYRLREDKKSCQGNI